MNPTEEHMITAALGGGSEISTEVLATLAEIGEDVNASLDLDEVLARAAALIKRHIDYEIFGVLMIEGDGSYLRHRFAIGYPRSEEHTSELQSRRDLVCRLLLEK